MGVGCMINDSSGRVPSYQHRTMRRTEKDPVEPADGGKGEWMPVLAAEKKALKLQFPQRLFRRH
jgi:hypothetical protein